MPPAPSMTSAPPQRPPPADSSSAPMTSKRDSFSADDTVLTSTYDVPSDAVVGDSTDDNDHVDHADDHTAEDVRDADGSRRASEEMAEYLDRVEGSDAVHDICSFSDVDLSSPRHGDEENPTHANDNNDSGAYARARKKYYLLPMLIRYHLPILGCILVFGMFVVAISLSAAIARDNRHTAQQMQQQPGSSAGDVIINDAPPVVYENVGSEGKSTIHSSKPLADAVAGDNDNNNANNSENSDETGEGEESLGEPMEETPPPTEATPARPAAAPTAVDAPTNPRWYTTSHPAYQAILLDESTNSGGGGGGSSDPVRTAHLRARDFCLSRSMTLCPYRRYCPDGPSSPPYDDRNESGTNHPDRVPSTAFDWSPSEWEQWAPLASSGETHDVGNGWVQVGKIGVGGGDDDDEGRCWIYEDWVGDADGSRGEVPDVGVANLRFLLCCPVESGSGTGNGSGGSGSVGAGQETGDASGV